MCIPDSVVSKTHRCTGVQFDNLHIFNNLATLKCVKCDMTYINFWLETEIVQEDNAQSFFKL